MKYPNGKYLEADGRARERGEMNGRLTHEVTHEGRLEINWGDGWRLCVAAMHKPAFELLMAGKFDEAMEQAIETHIENYGQHPANGKDPKYRCGLRVVGRALTTLELTPKGLRHDANTGTTSR